MKVVEVSLPKVDATVLSPLAPEGTAIGNQASTNGHMRRVPRTAEYLQLGMVIVEARNMTNPERQPVIIREQTTLVAALHGYPDSGIELAFQTRADATDQPTNYSSFKDEAKNVLGDFTTASTGTSAQPVLRTFTLTANEEMEYANQSEDVVLQPGSMFIIVEFESTGAGNEFRRRATRAILVEDDDNTPVLQVPFKAVVRELQTTKV